MRPVPSRSSPRFPAALLIALVAVLPSCSDGEPEAPRERPWTSLIDENRALSDLHRYVELGPANHAPENAERLEAGRRFIAEGLKAAGIADLREDEWVQLVATDRKVVMKNIIGVLPGKREDAILLGCHYDLKILPGEEGFQGANDGGSGVALTLELARAMAARAREEGPPELSVWFTFFDGEEAFVDWRASNRNGEPDNCYGSRRLAAATARGETPIRAVVILDMVGDADLRLTEDRNSTGEMLELFIRRSKEIFGISAFGAAKAVEDDHYPFVLKGIPAIDLIDFEFGPNNRHWHTSGDDLSRVSARSLAKVGTLVLETWPALETWVLERLGR